MCSACVLRVEIFRDCPAVDVVGRSAPDLEDRVDRLDEHLVAILIQDAERLRIRCQRARADAEDERPPERVSSIAASRRSAPDGLRQVRRAARSLIVLVSEISGRGTACCLVTRSQWS